MKGLEKREQITVINLCGAIGGVKGYEPKRHNVAFFNFIYRLTHRRTRLSIPPRALLVELAPSEQKLLEEEVEAKPSVTFEQALRVAVEEAGEQAALQEDWAPLDDSALPTTYSHPFLDRLWSPPPPRGPEYSEYALAHPLGGLTARQAARYGTTPAAWAARAARTAFL
ncbi:hypothetical protein JCM10213v2_001343 [Rhodosporidiobolus nylandii]